MFTIASRNTVTKLSHSLFSYLKTQLPQKTMAEPIICNFARAAIHHFTTKYMIRTHKLPRGSYSKIIHEYNQHFADAPNLQTTYTVASNKFLPITRIFGKKWHPDGVRQVFITTFTPTSWVSNDPLEKYKHTLCACKVCEEKHETLNQSFPTSKQLTQ